MKIRNGKIKLDFNEKRIGNFILRSDADYIKICDLNRKFIYSVSKDVPVGMFLSQSYDDFKDEQTSKGIGNYIGVMWAFFSAVPDVQFLEEAYKSAVDCIERHPEAYGVIRDDSDGADERAIDSVKEMKQLEEEMKQLKENEGKTTDEGEDSAGNDD